MFCSGTRTTRAPSALFIVLAALNFSCSPSKPPGIDRIAILRFENLTGDDALNWTGRAVSEVMSAELSGSPVHAVISFQALHASDRVFGPRPLSAPGISTEQPAATIAGANRILYGDISRRGSRLRLDATLFDTSRGKVERTLTATGLESEGVIRLADTLATNLASPVRRFETQNDDALREYCEGLEASDPAAAAAAFARSVATDPNFGQAYVAWAEWTAEQGNHAQVESIVALGAARGNAISAEDRARLAALAAEMRGDITASIRALDAAARLSPTDVQLLRRAAHMDLNGRNYPGAVKNLSMALAVEPQNVVLLNELGYAEMYAGERNEATKALEEYHRLQPGDPNAMDSLGDANYYFGEFAAAERYYRESYDKDPNFNDGGALLKAAYARLNTGDISGANAVFNQYVTAQRSAKDVLAEFRYGEWLFLSGQRQKAVEVMQGLAKSLPPAGAQQANAQIAVWQLGLGDRKHAQEFAERAQGQGLGALARFLTQSPASRAEWDERSARMLPDAGDQRTRQLMLAYALLLQNDFSSAVPVLQALYRHSAPSPHDILPVLIGWAEIENGHMEEAAPYVQRNPVPNPAPELFASVAFPRLLFLRGTVLQKQGQKDEAAKNLRLFATLSGPDGTR